MFAVSVEPLDGLAPVLVAPAVFGVFGSVVFLFDPLGLVALTALRIVGSTSSCAESPNGAAAAARYAVGVGGAAVGLIGSSIKLLASAED